MPAPWYVAVVFGTIGLSLALAAIAVAFIAVRHALKMWRDLNE